MHSLLLMRGCSIQERTAHEWCSPSLQVQVHLCMHLFVRRALATFSKCSSYMISNEPARAAEVDTKPDSTPQPEILETTLGQAVAHDPP